jgi:hypothetical protein
MQEIKIGDLLVCSCSGQSVVVVAVKGKYAWVRALSGQWCPSKKEVEIQAVLEICSVYRKVENGN